MQTCSKLLGQKPPKIDKLGLKSKIEKIEKLKPLKNTKTFLTELGYLKKGQKIQEWSIYHAFNNPKTPEDKVFLKKHFDWKTESKDLNFLKKLRSSNKSMIHDMVDYSWKYRNSGLNSETIYCENISTLENLIKDSKSFNFKNELTKFFNLSLEDIFFYEWFLEEPRTKLSKVVGQDVPTIFEEYDDRFLEIQRLKMDCFNHDGTVVKSFLTGHEFSVKNTTDIDSIWKLILDQFMTSKINDHILNSNKNHLITNTTIIEYD